MCQGTNVSFADLCWITNLCWITDLWGHLHDPTLWLELWHHQNPRSWRWSSARFMSRDDHLSHWSPFYYQSLLIHKSSPWLSVKVVHECRLELDQWYWWWSVLVGNGGCWLALSALIGDDQWWLAILAMDGVWTDFGFSFDAVPTIDTVLYFRRQEDGDGWSWIEET